MTDLRKDKRAPASLKVKYKSGTVDEFVEQFGTDVSLGGIFIKTKKPIEIGALLKLELQLSNASPVIHGVGRVCWRREPGPDPSLPAGMGIKFIKLDPGSRTIVERMVQSRGGVPSRFEQTAGAEIAPPSVPPAGAVPSLRPSAAAVASAQAKREPASAPKPAPTPPSRAASAASRPAHQAPSPASPQRSSSSGGDAVAGLFGDSPMARSAASGSALSSGHTQFFPHGSESGARPSSPSPGRAKQGSSPGLRAQEKPAQSDQSRQSGAFLATAFAEGGVAAPATRGKPSASDAGEDELIDQLFADVMDAPAGSPAPPSASAAASIDAGESRESREPGGASAATRDVEDVFAALSEEEGLGSAPRQRPSSSGMGAWPERDSEPGRASEEPDAAESVDALFPDLDESPTSARASAPHAPPSYAPDADSPAALQDEEQWQDAPSELEEDLGGASSMPPNALSLDPPRLSSAPPPSALTHFGKPQRSSSSLIGIALVLLAAAAGGGYYYTQIARPQSARAPQAPAAGIAPAATGEASGAAAGAAAGPGVPLGEPGAEGEAAAGEREPTAAAEPVEIEITAVPRGAEVRVDGKRIGNAPLRATLARGREASVEVRSTGYATMTRAVTPAADNEPLRFKLEPLPFELVVRTDPPGAELSYGDRTAIAPGPLALGHVDGAVNVSISKEGYRRMTRPLRLDEFREDDGVMRAKIDVRLSPLPGVSGAPGAAVQTPRPRGRRSRAAPQPAPEAPPEPSAQPAAPAQPSAAPPESMLNPKPAPQPAGPRAASAAAAKSAPPPAPAPEPPAERAAEPESPPPEPAAAPESPPEP